MLRIRLPNLREAWMRRYRGIILPLSLLCLSLLQCLSWCEAAPAPRLRPSGVDATLTQFKTVQQPDQTSIRFQIDGATAVQKIGFQSVQELAIQLARTRTKLPSPVRVDVSPISAMTFEQLGTDLKITLQLTRKAEYSISQEPGFLTLQLVNTPLEKLVSLNLDNQPIGRVLVMLSRQYGANIVAGSEIQGSISVHLTDVPLRAALDQILETEGYRYEEASGGVLRVVADDRRQKLQDALQKAETQQKYHVVEPKHISAMELSTLLEGLIGESGGIVASDRTNTVIISTTGDQWSTLEPLIQTLDREVDVPSSAEATQTDQVTGTVSTAPVVEEIPAPPALKAEIIRLSYVDPNEVSSLLTPLLSPDGSMLVLGKIAGSSEREIGTASRLGGSIAMGGTLMVKDIPQIVMQIRELADEMDLPIDQVEIQAYIVEGTLTKDDNVGIDWRAVDGDNELTASLPFGGPFPALQLRVGSLSANDFAGVLQMISSRTDTRILSNPKITSVSGRPAVFQSGDQIPYTEVVVSQNVESVATGFKETGIILEVAATVKREDMVSLTLFAEVSDVSGFTPTGQPRITGRTASAQVLAANGDTVALGGLVSNRTDETVSKVPLLGDIPLLGQLFRTKNTSQLKSEVTVFITPRIVREQ